MKKLLQSLGLLMFLFAGQSAMAGTVTYVYTDPQGTPLAEADATGTITARFDYAPYGVASTASGMSGAPNGPGYTGHVNDPESGFVYMQARYYDPAVGRFLSVDPGEKSQVDGLFVINRYDYANGNPIRYIDPDGRQALMVSTAPVMEEPILLRAGTRINPLSEAVREGLRSPVPRTPQEQAQQLAKEAGLKPSPAESEWKTEIKEPWLPPDMEHFDNWDGTPDLFKLMYHMVRILASGHPTVTVGKITSPPPASGTPTTNPGQPVQPNGPSNTPVSSPPQGAPAPAPADPPPPPPPPLPTDWT